MKTVLKIALGLMLPLMLVTLPAKATPTTPAHTPPECLADVNTLIDDINNLAIQNTKPEQVLKIKNELLKFLNEAKSLLSMSGTPSQLIQNQYRAAIQVWKFDDKFLDLRKKISATDLETIDGKARNTLVCIVYLYCPTCHYNPF